MGYSVAGSSSHAALLALLAQENVDAKPTPVGGVTPSFTAGMTGQIDAAWSTIPIGLKEIDEGRIRVIARAADIKSLQNRTVRVNMTSAATLEKKKAAFDRYMAAYRETIDYMYSSPEALVTFAEIAKVPLVGRAENPGPRAEERAQPRSDRRHGCDHGGGGRDQVHGRAALQGQDRRAGADAAAAEVARHQMPQRATRALYCRYGSPNFASR